MIQGWIVCAFISIMLCINGYSRNGGDELQNRINALEVELHTIRNSIGAVSVKCENSQSNVIWQPHAAGGFSRVEQRISF